VKNILLFMTVQKKIKKCFAALPMTDLFFFIDLVELPPAFVRKFRDIPEKRESL